MVKPRFLVSVGTDDLQVEDMDIELDSHEASDVIVDGEPSSTSPQTFADAEQFEEVETEVVSEQLLDDDAELVQFQSGARMNDDFLVIVLVTVCCDAQMSRRTCSPRRKSRPSHMNSRRETRVLHTATMTSHNQRKSTTLRGRC